MDQGAATSRGSAGGGPSRPPAIEVTRAGAYDHNAAHRSVRGQRRLGDRPGIRRRLVIVEEVRAQGQRVERTPRRVIPSRFSPTATTITSVVAAAGPVVSSWPTVHVEAGGSRRTSGLGTV
ncbi:MAG: hypothetical protein ACRCSN_02805 [Dermatophilaceae bacterium]